jgi:hypothetical protein
VKHKNTKKKEVYTFTHPYFLGQYSEKFDTLDKLLNFIAAVNSTLEKAEDNLSKDELQNWKKLCALANASPVSIKNYSPVDLSPFYLSTCTVFGGYQAANASFYLASVLQGLIDQKKLYGVRICNEFQTQNILGKKPYLRPKTVSTKSYSKKDLGANKHLIQMMLDHILEKKVATSTLMSLSENCDTKYQQGKRTVCVAVTGSRFYSQKTPQDEKAGSFEFRVGKGVSLR